MSYWYAARTASPRAHPVCRKRPRPARGRGPGRRRGTHSRCPLPCGAGKQELFRFSVLSYGKVISIAVKVDTNSDEHLLDTKHDTNTPVAWIPPHVQQARCKHLPTPGTNLLQKASHYYSRQFRTPLNHPRCTLLSPRWCNQQCQAYRIVQQAAL